MLSLSSHLIIISFCNSTFLIMKSCSKSTAEKQGKICWLVARWNGGWFLGGLRWFLLVAGDMGCFQSVCCFNSYTNFTTYRTVISLLYSWTHVNDWGIRFFFQNKTAKKRVIVVLSPSRLKISDYFLYYIALLPTLLFPILSSTSDKTLLLK